MASVHEKTVAQGSVVAHAKWSLTQVLLYKHLHHVHNPIWAYKTNWTVSHDCTSHGGAYIKFCLGFYKSFPVAHIDKEYNTVNCREVVFPYTTGWKQPEKI